MAEGKNQEVKTKRQLLNERLTQRYPDMDFSDEENFYGRISDDYDDYDKNIAGYQEREKTFSDLFSADPRAAHFLTNWRNGSDPVIELVRNFGTEIKDAIDDPERLKEIAEANKEFVAKVAKEKELEEAYQANLNERLKTNDDMQKKSGISDEDVDKAMALLGQIVADGVVGKFTPESIQLALKAINHDADVAAANEEGMVAGKNTKVEEKLRKSKKGDGTTPLEGRNNGAAPQRRQPSLGALDNYGQGNTTIWERGNEKRRSAN